MDTLFGNKTISTISFTQDEIIRDIINLYTPNGIECDVTYSEGGFYKNITKPALKFDIEPQFDDVVKSCSTNLPLEDKSITSMMFDPPFIASWNVGSSDYIMKKRFSNVSGIHNLRNMYSDSIKEFARVIKSQGILIIKCQDTVYSGKQYFNHCFIHDKAVELGFMPVDLFILLARTRFIGPHKQRTARKYHSYFWVFKKLRYKRKKS